MTSMGSMLTSVLGAIYVLSEFGLSVVKRASSSNSKLADRGSLLVLWVVIIVSVNLALLLARTVPAAGFGTASPAAALLGAVLFVSGLSLRWYAIIFLGRFFTVNVAIAADHQLIDGGPYRYARHPSYTGALLAFLGLGLSMGNWASVAVITVPTFLVFLWRIRVEETALLQGLGDQYQRYMDRTKRLIPAIY
jgi:protein-S-isoprenylcysteine O-methyltransferase